MSSSKKIKAIRYHDISCGHRVAGHENKCAMLHGHNYRVTFTCIGKQDSLGRVLDFSVIKEKLCMWLEENWDHKFLAWENDPVMQALAQRMTANHAHFDVVTGSIVWTVFNPTAENMAYYLLAVVGPDVLAGTGVVLSKVKVEETRKCSASAEL